MKKKIVALALALSMVAGLTACGNGAKDVEAKDVTLLVWSPSEDQAESTPWLQTMCEKFDEAHPEWNITFEYGVCAEGDAKSTVTQDPENAADVYMFANDNLADLKANGAIAKLGGSTLDYVMNEIPASLVTSVTADGGVYGIPFTSNTWFMYYNKSILSDADVANLETMLSKTKVAFPLTNSWYIASFYAANGCTLFGDGTDEAAGIDFAGDKAVAVTNYLVDLAANPNFVNDADGAGMAGLDDGTIGAIFSGSWDYENVVAAIGAENVGAAKLPTITIDGAEKQMMAFSGSKAIGVNPHCEDQEVAIALAAFLGSEEAQVAHFEMRNVIPANTKAASNEAVASNVVAVAQSATVAETAILQPTVPNMGRYWGPAESMGKELVAKTVTHENAETKTAELNESLNKDAVE